MATFNQHNQTVHGNQYNAETINVGNIESKQDFSNQLKSFHNELEKAIEGGVINGECAIDADANIKKVIVQTASETPEKSKILDYLTKTKDLVSQSTELTTALSTLITAVGSLF